MKLTANQLTVFRVAFLPLPYFLVYGGKFERVAAIATFAILGLTDYLDGLLARRDGGTKLGALLDPLADKIFVAVTLIPIADLRILPFWVVWPIFLREFLVTDLRRFLASAQMELPVTELAKIKTTLQMTGAGLILLTDTFPDKTVSAAFLSGALLATIFLAVGLYWRDGSITHRIRTALGLLVLGLAILAIFKTQDANLAYGIVMLGITLASGAHYVIVGLPICVKKGLASFVRLVFTLAFPMLPLVFVDVNIIGAAGVVVLIIVFEFVSQGIDMWVLREGFFDVTWIKSWICLPVAVIVLASAVDILGGIGGIRLYLLASVFLSGSYMFFDVLVHRRPIYNQLIGKKT